MTQPQPPAPRRRVSSYDVSHDEDIYSAAVTVPRHSTPILVNIGMPIAAIGGAIAFLSVEGRSVSGALVCVVWLGLWCALHLAVRLPVRTVRVGLGRRSVSLSQDDDVRRIPLSAIANVEISPMPYAGEDLGPAIAQYLVRGMYTLTIDDTTGGRFHCAIDIGTEYGDRIAQALLSRKAPISPWQGYQQLMRTRQADEQDARPAKKSMPAGPSLSHEQLWRESVAQHDRILLAYGEYETDPLLLLRYPAIVDVTVDESADFFHSLSEASALRSDAFPGPGEAFEAYRIAVRTLTQAWAKSEKKAKSLGISALSDPDQRRISQTVKLLRHAEGASSSLERGAYLQQARAILDKLVESGAITPPPRMLFEIQAAASQALTGGAGEPAID